MGSVTRRFKRNIMSKNLATRIKVISPPIRLGDKVFKPTGNTHMIHWRTIMLRTISIIRKRNKVAHDQEQKRSGHRGKVSRFFGDWSKSWIRRMLEKIWPSLNEEVREARKAERERKRQLRELTPALRDAVQKADSR